ncbi:hypothetical protein DOY81_007330 [Sarcophaga bullata]|nr:hypothetical protein DOY81_007330 [Sarcophaga bullata]
MNDKNRTLKSILVLIVIKIFMDRNAGIVATKLLNVRRMHRLQSRSLLFPPTAPTRVQFIGGIGIPVEDLSFESVTSGYVLKAEYFLPERADEFRQKLKPQTIHRRSVNETLTFIVTDDDFRDQPSVSQSSNLTKEENHAVYRQYIKQQEGNAWKNQQKYGACYRWIVYKAIEMILNKSSLNGKACMLRSICEHAAVPLNYEGGLLAEIIHIVLTPSSSRDDDVKPNHNSYLRAEILGRSGENCEKAFSRCSKSPLEIISSVFET